ncbi:MAG: hypothetical protein J7K98_03480 [Candidatus Aenigmarchaeota archaeon]|nr:hypothetical protein [Candidatus Aenigmarchaeota archaeon]
MADPFTLAIQRIADYGFFNFLVPWIIITAFLYALLKKGKILGESNFINGTVALAMSFFILYFPIASGVEDLGAIFSRFIMQMIIFLMIFIFGAIGASILYPDLSAMLKEQMTHRTFLYIFVLIALVAFVTSGMLNVYIYGAMGIGKGSPAKKDIYTFAGAIIIMVVILIIASWIVIYMKQRYGG